MQTDKIPILETPRLRLRGYRPEDCASAMEMWRDEKVHRFLGRAFTREEIWARLLRYVGHWALLGYGFWAIEHKASGQLIGEGGFCDFQRDIAWPSYVLTQDAQHEIGWAFCAAYHGQGFATEAVQAMTQWADQHFDHRRTICIINPANAASLRVAQKCGYREIGTVHYKENNVGIFAREAASKP